jgi:hypothetical protein
MLVLRWPDQNVSDCRSTRLPSLAKRSSEPLSYGLDVNCRTTMPERAVTVEDINIDVDVLFGLLYSDYGLEYMI